MKTFRCTIILAALLIAGQAFGQMQIDKAIQLTGSGSDAKIEGIQEVSNPTDAANKAYVDSLVSAALSQAPSPQSYFHLSVDVDTVTLGQNGLSNPIGSITVTHDSGYVSSVSLSANGVPSGASVIFGTPLEVPPYSSTLQFSSTTVTAGFYPIDIIGTTATHSDTVQVMLEVVSITGKKIFQTVNHYTGNLGGLSGADAKCNTEAATYSLTGSYIALLSTSSVNMKDRVTVSSLFVRPDGLVVANDKTDLFDGTLQNKIDINAAGTANPTDNPGRSFTGSNGSGNSAGSTVNCSNWTSNSGTGVTGENKSTTGGSFWYDGSNSCGTPTFIYCIEQ